MPDAQPTPTIDTAAALGLGEPQPERARGERRRSAALAAALIGAIAATAAVRVATGSDSDVFPLVHVALALAAGWLLPWELALAAAWTTAVATQVPTVLDGPDAALANMLEGLAITAVAGAALLVVRYQRERVDAAEAEDALPLVDAASGLANAHALELRARAELSRARRHELPLTLLWIVLDGLHPDAASGDLRRLGAAALGALRGEDLVARAGDGELAALLPEASVVDSGAIGARVEAALKRALEADAALAGVRASIGAAHFPADALTVDELAAAARARALEPRPAPGA